MRGVGCPHCQNSILEEKTARQLDNNKIKYIWHCRKEDLPWLDRQSLDFFLPKYNIAIECQGKQHFEAVDFFGGKKAFEYRKELDVIKSNLCKEHQIKLFCINYNDDFNKKINELVELCGG